MIGAGVHLFICLYVCDPQKSLYGTLEVDLPFQTLALDFRQIYSYAMKHFTRICGHTIPESTARKFRDAYLTPY